ncbi:MAG: TolC family protein [Deltaproteobacteria bacterium]|nr:TolC family protein [Deltaproteobacteria bacterium]
MALIGAQLASGIGYADSSPPEQWTLSRIIRRASENSADLKSLEKEVLRADHTAEQAGKWDNPEVSLDAGPKSISILIGNVFDASIRQNIPLFGQKSIEADIGRNNRKILETDKNIRAVSVRHQAARLAYRLAAVLEQVKHIGHRREKLQTVAQYLTTRPFASPSQFVEKNLIQNRLREIEEKFLAITASKEKVWHELNVFLNLDAAITPEMPWLTNPKELNREKLWDQVRSRNLELFRQNQLIEAAELSIAKAGKKGYPEVRIGAGYSEQNVELGERSYVGILELSLPIVDRGGYARQAAESQKDAETYRLEQKRRELLAQFEQAWAELTENRKRIALYPVSLVNELESAMSKAEINWKKSLVPVTAFLELESQVHEQAVRVFDAQTAYVEALSRVWLLAGLDFQPEAQ